MSLSGKSAFRTWNRKQQVAQWSHTQLTSWGCLLTSALAVWRCQARCLPCEGLQNVRLQCQVFVPYCSLAYQNGCRYMELGLMDQPVFMQIMQAGQVLLSGKTKEFLAQCCQTKLRCKCSVTISLKSTRFDTAHRCSGFAKGNCPSTLDFCPLKSI